MAQQLVGRTHDVVGRVFHDLIGCQTPNTNKQSGCPFERMITTGEVTMIPSHLWTRADGTAFELATTFWPRVQRAERVGAVIVARDLTSEMEIQRDVQRVARLAEESPNPIVAKQTIDVINSGETKTLRWTENVMFSRSSTTSLPFGWPFLRG